MDPALHLRSPRKITVLFGISVQRITPTCRASRGLSPSSKCALPGAHKKKPQRQGWGSKPICCHTSRLALREVKREGLRPRSLCAAILKGKLRMRAVHLNNKCCRWSDATGTGVAGPHATHLAPCPSQLAHARLAKYIGSRMPR